MSVFECTNLQCTLCYPATREQFERLKVLTAHDPVSHPAHYTRGKIEVIAFIEDQQLGYHLGQVIKYVCRAGHKDKDKYRQDLEKARWYLDREINRKNDDKGPDPRPITADM